MKPTEDILLLELCMKDKNEGCTLENIIVFCEKHKITYYALDFRFITCSTNKDNQYHRMNHYPILYFMLACNHLYPIEDTRTQLSISQINKSIGKPVIKSSKQLTPINMSNVEVVYHWARKFKAIKNPDQNDSGFWDCSPGWTRTSDLVINSHPL